MGAKVGACIILGAGEIKDYAAAAKLAELIAPGAFVICADGWLAHCERLGLSPDLLVGDFDSAQPVPSATETIYLNAVTALAVNRKAILRKKSPGRVTSGGSRLFFRINICEVPYTQHENKNKGNTNRLN